VRNIRCNIGDEELGISVATNTDLSLEERTLAIQGDLFEDIYGLKVRLEKE
jgi:hypothetical protein